MFSGKNSNGHAEYVFNDILHPATLYYEISCYTISLQFSAFLLPRKFPQTFQRPSRLLFMQKFLLYWSRSSNSCVICLPKKISFFILALRILGNFCLK
jgi:hypothetical protein